MEKKLLNSPQHSEVNLIDSILAEMVLDKAIRDFQKEMIQKEIDHSLLQKDKDTFIRLTNKLKDLS